jgi:signal transduction histidine kinase
MDYLHQLIQKVSHAKNHNEVIHILDSAKNEVSRVDAASLENLRLVSQLREANLNLEECLQARDEFLSVATHEIKTPLTALKLQLELANKKMQSGTPDTTESNLLTNPLRQVNNLVALIDQLMDLSRIRLNLIELNYSLLDLSQVTKEVVDRYVAEFVAAGCPVTLKLSAPIIGEWDRLRIEQILANLFSNIIKYAPRCAVDISSNYSPDKEFAVLSIRDHGPGIAEEAQARIFGKFERASSNRATRGLGLGLFITHQLVEAMHGNIDLDTSLGNGTLFKITLPLRRKDQDRPPLKYH